MLGILTQEERAALIRDQGGTDNYTVPLYATPPDHRDAMRQALSDICAARLCEVNSMSSRQEMLRLMIRAADALRKALGEGNE